MKLKNTNFLEQHLEKVVIAIAVLFAGFVAFVYYLGDPYAVDIRGEGDVSPDQVEDVVLRKVGQLERALQSDEWPFEQIQVPAYKGEQTPTALSFMGIDPSVVRVEPAQKPEYWLPPVPAVAELKVDSDYFVLAEPQAESPADVVKIREALKALVGPSFPDAVAVRVTGVFDNDAWFNALATPPAG